MKPVFCFIDDTSFELANFEENALAAFARVEFVLASSFAEARTLLRGRLPLCFLLDIYGLDPEGRSDSAALRPPEPAALAAALGQAGPLESLYEGLTPGGEGANAFLRRLYARVEGWQRAFQLAAGGLGQSRAYGLYNLARVREHYPWAAALGYSRKALYADAAAFCLAGADGVMQKPQGADEPAIARATLAEAPALVRAAYAAVERRLAAMASQLAARLCREGTSLVLAEALEDGVRHLALAGPREEPGCGLAEACRALEAFRYEDLDLPSPDLGLVLNLRQWLNSIEGAP